MWPAIISALRVVGTAATGYWLNDVGTWIANVTGIGGKVTKTNGGFQWWYVLLVALLMAAAVGLVIWLLSSVVLSPVRRKRRRK